MDGKVGTPGGPLCRGASIHSTQRAESIHAAIKGRKMKNLAAVALINALHDYNSTSRQRREVEAVRKFETGSIGY